MLSCHLIVDPPADGAWNMALDEAVLEATKVDGVGTLRFYSWREPTLSLGSFQAHAERKLHAASLACPLVRRASGGGAILHDDELTYSIVLPQSHPAAARPDRLYQAFHQTLADTLTDFGFQATLANPLGSPTNSEPFLCFQRRTAGDVLLGNHKIAGSAQRRHQRAVLQHGSILLKRSAFAPELPGIGDIAGKRIEIGELRIEWQQRISRQLELDFIETSLPEAILLQTERFRQKFSSAEWTCRR
jgi:lipoate-protein ligase A